MSENTIDNLKVCYQDPVCVEEAGVCEKPPAPAAGLPALEEMRTGEQSLNDFYYNVPSVNSPDLLRPKPGPTSLVGLLFRYLASE